MPHWTLNQLGSRIGGRIIGNKNLEVQSLVFDSRTASPGEGTMFVALRGEYHDGHDYIEVLYRRGFRLFLVSRVPGMKSTEGAGFCVVEDTLKGLQDLAGERRKLYPGHVVAVTGSNGKTIVKEWAYQLLNRSKSVYRSPKSYNSQLGVPLSLWMMQDRHQLAIIEAGISRPGEMEKLQTIIAPRTGVFTNLGTAHQENFENLEEKLREKLILFKDCETVILRQDQAVNSRPLSTCLEGFGGKLVTWSLGGEAVHAFVLEKKESDRTTLAYIPRDRNHGESRIRFRLPFGDEASIENALHVFVLALECGMPVAEAAERISILEPVSMRLELLRGIQGNLLINDSYNSDVAGLAAALNLMDQQEKKSGKVVILSDLFQSGMEEQDLYSSIGEIVEQRGTDLFVGIGPSMMKNRLCFREGSLFFPDTGQFLSGMDRSRFRDQTILIKGSRSFGFEKITEELQLKSHQTLLEIDLNAMVNNLNHYRSLLRERVKTMVMVKALAYGSGQAEIAHFLQFHNVDYLAVAFTDEGVALRNAGIHLPILVLNPDPVSYGPLIESRLEPGVYNSRGLEALYTILQYRGISGYPIHVKVDTGMHRLGFQEEEITSLVPLLKRKEFAVASLFSHLAASGEEQQDEFTRLQISRFDQMASRLEKKLGRVFIKHILNSSGVERFPEGQYDMVRLGIGLHGVGESDMLKPVSTFKSSVSQVFKVKKGETIGYSRMGKALKDSQIATVPVGYADGFSRNLGNGRGRVWILGRYAPTIGNICMDMTMLDVTGLGVAEGDEVELFGNNQPVEELADMAGTIPYELLSSIPERVKRVYLQE